MISKHNNKQHFKIIIFSKNVPIIRNLSFRYRISTVILNLSMNINQSSNSLNKPFLPLSSKSSGSNNLLNFRGPKQSLGDSLRKLTNPYRRIQILISIIIVVLSTLWVQITMQRHGPFIRTAQCYFNQLVLLHDSQDIYQGEDVITWKNGESYSFIEMQDMFARLATTLKELPTNSLFNVSTRPPSLQQQPSVQLLTIYQFDIPASYHKFQTFNSSMEEIEKLFTSTLFNRTFYQHLWKIDISVKIPIVYRRDQVTIQLSFAAQIFSSMLMQYKMEIDLLDSDKDKINTPTPQSQQNLKIRKLNNPYDMELSIPFLSWIVLALYVLVFMLQLRFIIQKKKYVDQKIKRRIEQQHQLERLLQKIDEKPTNQRNSINSDGYSFIMTNSLIDENNKQDDKYIVPLLKRGQKIGYYYILQVVVSLIAFGGFYDNANGFICFFSWFKIILYLAQTKNRLMFGFLFQQTIPTYLRVYLNIILLITAFVMFNMLVLTVTKKFETLQLGYFQYFFNYFQYGIYQNFMFAFRPYGLFAAFFYFLQIMILLYIGNNILISVLANQVSKNSYLSGVEEMIDGLNVKCPNCGADFQSSRTDIKERHQQNKKHVMISKLMRDLQLQKMRNFSNIGPSSNNDSSYNITIKSPILSPFFPIKNQKKLSQQEFLSPKLKNGNFQKQLKEINKKMQNQQFSSESKLEAIEQLRGKLESSKQINIQLSDSRLQKQAESKFHKKLRMKIQLLFNKIDKFPQMLKKQSLKNKVSIAAKQKQKEVTRQILEDLLKKITTLQQKISK